LFLTGHCQRIHSVPLVRVNDGAGVHTVATAQGYVKRLIFAGISAKLRQLLIGSIVVAWVSSIVIGHEYFAYVIAVITATDFSESSEPAGDPYYWPENFG
jgi:hypothetical protein